MKLTRPIRLALLLALAVMLVLPVSTMLPNLTVEAYQTEEINSTECYLQSGFGNPSQHDRTWDNDASYHILSTWDFEGHSEAVIVEYKFITSGSLPDIIGMDVYSRAKTSKQTANLYIYNDDTGSWVYIANFGTSETTKVKEYGNYLEANPYISSSGEIKLRFTYSPSLAFLYVNWLEIEMRRSDPDPDYQYTLVMIYAACDSGQWDSMDPVSRSIYKDFFNTYNEIWDDIANNEIFDAEEYDGLAVTMYVDPVDDAPQQYRATQYRRWGNPYENEVTDGVSTEGEVNSADPTTLETFVENSISFVQNLDDYFTSTLDIRKLLVIYDHGHSFVGTCLDENTGLEQSDRLTPAELRPALTNKFVDVVMFHTCIMGTFEVAYSLRDITSFMIGATATIKRPSEAEYDDEENDLRSTVFNPTTLLNWKEDQRGRLLAAEDAARNFSEFISTRKTFPNCTTDEDGNVICVTIATHNGALIENLASEVNSLGNQIRLNPVAFQWLKTNIDIVNRTDNTHSYCDTGGNLVLWDFMDAVSANLGIDSDSSIIAELLVDEDLEGDHYYLGLFLPNSTCFTCAPGSITDKYFGISKIEEYIFNGEHYSSFMDPAGGWNQLIKALYCDYNEISLWDIDDNFDGPTLDPMWTVTLDGNPYYDYYVGPWGSDSWLYCGPMTGGSVYKYNGYYFTTALPSAYTGAFTVESELRWEASSDWPIYHVGIRLLDSDGNSHISVKYWDAWAGSTRRKRADIEGSSYYVSGLPLSDQAAIQITRDSENNVQIFWGGSLLHSGVSSTAIAKIQIHITCHQTYTGGKAGVNYIRAIDG